MREAIQRFNIQKHDVEQNGFKFKSWLRHLLSDLELVT